GRCSRSARNSKRSTQRGPGRSLGSRETARRSLPPASGATDTESQMVLQRACRDDIERIPISESDRRRCRLSRELYELTISTPRLGLTTRQDDHETVESQGSLHVLLQQALDD